MFCESFSDKVIEHFMSPRNAGSMPDADGIGNGGDPSCGDSLTIYIKVKNNIISDISFLVFGCVAAIATSSMTTELVKGKPLEEALKLTDTDITEALGGLPENKLHCSVLGATALKNAIENYRSKTPGLQGENAQ
ncbi:MAG: iron-sulfur cluster assembly scaffold protein [Bacteroidaceae bacterium]